MRKQYPIISLGLALGVCGLQAQAQSAAPGDTYAINSSSRLISFNRAAPGETLSSVKIKGLADDESILGADFRPSDGSLILLGSTGTLYTVDLETGLASFKATLAADPINDPTPDFVALSGDDFGVDFNPVVNRLRVVSNSGQNLRINVDTGATITDGVLNPGVPEVAAAAYTNSQGAACRTQLFVIDTGTDTLYLQNPPNNGTLVPIGAGLGVGDIGEVSGFDVQGNNTALAALRVKNSTQLYSVDLSTGVATALGQIGETRGQRMRALMLPIQTSTQAPGELVGLTAESNRLISFNSAAPGKLCTSPAVSGLAAGETLLGIDTRRSSATDVVSVAGNGLLYGLGSSGRLYTLDAANGAATPGQTLVEAVSVANCPAGYAGLIGSHFAVDFNPAANRLRIISDAGQNLRVNVDNGVSCNDGAINPAGSVISAAGYTNNDTDAGTGTTLYDIDAASDSLVIQNPPNNGTVAAVGSLNINITGVNGFDIFGGSNTALGAFTLDGQNNSRLYSVNLDTGAAAATPSTAINAGANVIGGGEPLKGLTAR